MAGIEGYNFENLSNITEKLALAELGRQLDNETDDICKCNDCVVDMAAIALNRLKPVYRSSLLGELYTDEAARDKNYVKSVSDAVKFAIEKVRANPSHN
ncbi:MAG: late competence development ComFB family protein [Spirochaetaceae bacterium]|jgi:competence protein ComFB|nr:late competence development ComFB family protein [Spirochaetaceae bacterium]